jgi:hypothetical protein
MNCARVLPQTKRMLLERCEMHDDSVSPIREPVPLGRGEGREVALTRG